MTVYYKDQPIDESDYSQIAQTFKLPYSIVAQAIETIEEGKEILFSAVSGSTRDRLRALSEVLTTNAPEPDSEEPEEPTSIIIPDQVIQPIQIMENQPDEPEFPVATSEDEIVNHAATALMQSFTDPAGCFIINPDGCCSINPDNPPSIVESYQAVSHILKLKELGEIVDDKSSWMLGSAIAALEDFHGEEFSISQICEDSELNFNTTYQAVSVFKAFPKRFKLSFSHHQEAYFANICEDQKKNKEVKNLILKKAETYTLGSKQVRALCSIAKSMDGDDQVIRNIRSADQAKDLISAYRAAKAQFIVYNEGVWITFNDAVDAEHQGKIVLNLKNLTAIVGDAIVEIKKTGKPSYDEDQPTTCQPE